MKHLRIFAFFAAVLTLYLLFVRFSAPGMHRPASTAQRIVRSAAPDAKSPDLHTLFPDLREDAITAITVATPQQSFRFQRKGPDAVSVNGRQGDGEVFLTLLEQITQLPVDSRSAFAPDTDKLLLTLIVYEDGVQHTARFYADGAQGEIAHIISGSTDAPQYRQTGGWRVGTLMMTCEGTRIQDAHGNELPAI